MDSGVERYLGSYPSAREAAVAIAKHAISLETFLEWSWVRNAAADEVRQRQREAKRQAAAAKLEEEQVCTLHQLRTFSLPTLDSSAT